MDSDKGPVVFPLLTLGEVFHVKILSVIFLIISLADYFLGCILLTPNRLNQQGKIFSIVFISQHKGQMSSIAPNVMMCHSDP